MAPFACFATFPVSRVRARPPTSTVTICGAGMCVFSDMNHFLWLRVRAEHVEAHSRGERPGICVGRIAAIHEEEQEARNIVRLTKRDGPHPEKIRHYVSRMPDDRLRVECVTS